MFRCEKQNHATKVAFQYQPTRLSHNKKFQLCNFFLFLFTITKKATMKSERIKQEDPTKQELMKTITRSRSSTAIKSSRDPPRRSSRSADKTAIKMEDRDEAYVLIKNESKDPKEESPVKVEVEDETKLEGKN